MTNPISPVTGMIFTAITDVLDKTATDDPASFARLAFLDDRDYREIAQNLCDDLMARVDKLIAGMNEQFGQQDIDRNLLLILFRTKLDLLADRAST